MKDYIYSLKTHLQSNKAQDFGLQADEYYFEDSDLIHISIAGSRPVY